MAKRSKHATGPWPGSRAAINARAARIRAARKMASRAKALLVVTEARAAHLAARAARAARAVKYARAAVKLTAAFEATVGRF